MMKTYTAQLQNYQKAIFASFCAICVLMAGLYSYFVLHSISQVLLRADLEKQITRVESRVSDLELQYVERKNALSLAEAKALGFNESVAKLFVTKKTGRGLSFNNEI